MTKWVEQFTASALGASKYPRPMNRHSRRLKARLSRGPAVPRPIVPRGQAQVAVVVHGLKIAPLPVSGLDVRWDRSHPWTATFCSGAETADFLDPETVRAIGALEAKALRDAKVVFRSSMDVGEGNCSDDHPFLEQALYAAMNSLLNFITQLWQIRDNAVHFEFGFLKSSHGVFSRILHNNLVTKADGTWDGETAFSPDEIERVLQNSRPMSETEVSEFSTVLARLATRGTGPGSPTNLRKTDSRGARMDRLLMLARATPDLAVKVAQYVACLEAMLATDNSDLSFKLAERVAWLIAKSGGERRTVFDDIRQIYNVRSRVLHGDGLPQKDIAQVARLAGLADSYLRRVVQFANDDARMSELIARNNSEALEDFFRELTVGKREAGPSS